MTDESIDYDNMYVWRTFGIPQYMSWYWTTFFLCGTYKTLVISRCFQEKGKDARGVLALFKYCKQLRHLNIGDGHNHIVPPGGALVCEALDAIKGQCGLAGGRWAIHKSTSYFTCINQPCDLRT